MVVYYNRYKIRLITIETDSCSCRCPWQCHGSCSCSCSYSYSALAPGTRSRHSLPLPLPLLLLFLNFDMQVTLLHRFPLLMISSMLHPTLLRMHLYGFGSLQRRAWGVT